ncbi:hypothetical protein ACFSQ7_47990 [Paenibacillus rhizoplanae]
MIINNAGIIHRSDDATVLVDMDDEAMAHIYNVNTLGGAEGKQRIDGFTAARPAASGG